MSKGWVYVLTNEHMPGLVKIGCTTRTVGERALELYQTGVPTPFRVECCLKTPNCRDLEASVHAELGPYRVNKSREFFKCSELVAVTCLETAHYNQLSELVEEYIPTHFLGESRYSVDEGCLLLLARKVGEAPEDIATALAFLEPEEVQFVMSRVRRLPFPVLGQGRDGE